MNLCSLCFMLMLFPPSYSYWWYLGDDQVKPCDDKSKLRLTPSQQKDCIEISSYKGALRNGLQGSISQCKEEFRNHRWNCHTDSLFMNLFGNIVNKECGETAFIRAIMTAGAVYGVVQACSDGDLVLCGCKQMNGLPAPKMDEPGWTWGGCSDDIENAMTNKTLQFADSPHLSTSLMDKIATHNNQAGYLAVKGNTKQICKCQGLSGSCTVKTCYQRSPSLEKIGQVLMNKFQLATRVMSWYQGDRWELFDPTGIKPTPSDLVFYVDTNPEHFCEPNDIVGSLGTVGRQCNVTSYGPDACANLCCARGFLDRPRVVQYDCECKFVYEHLEMRCSRCQKTVQEAFCM